MVEPNGPAGKPSKKKHGGIIALAVVVVIVVIFAIIMLTPIHKSIPGLSTIDIALPGSQTPSVEQPADKDSGDQGSDDNKTGSDSGSKGSGVASSKKDDGKSGKAASSKSPLVGTWTGNLSGDSDVYCVASQTKTPTVTIKSVDPDTGTVTADITFNFHNHAQDQDGTEDGDEQTELKDLEFMLADAQTQDGQVVAGTFQYKPSVVADYGTTAECQLSGEINTRRLTLTIDERGGDNNPGVSYRDTFVLTKN